MDHANTLKASGYGVYKLKIGQRMNKIYAATTVIADARGAESRQISPGEGRSMYAGVELKY